MVENGQEVHGVVRILLSQRATGEERRTTTTSYYCCILKHCNGYASVCVCACVHTHTHTHTHNHTHAHSLLTCQLWGSRCPCLCSICPQAVSASSCVHGRPGSDWKAWPVRSSATLYHDTSTTKVSANSLDAVHSGCIYADLWLAWEVILVQTVIPVDVYLYIRLCVFKSLYFWEMKTTTDKLLAERIDWKHEIRPWLCIFWFLNLIIYPKETCIHDLSEI